MRQDNTDKKDIYDALPDEKLVEHLSLITEVSEETIRACEYERERLIDIFARAVDYQDQIAEGHRNLKALPSSYSVNFRTGGQYSRTVGVEHFENAVLAAHINARVTGYEQSLTRLAGAIRTDAVLRQMAKPRP